MPTYFQHAPVGGRGESRTPKAGQGSPVFETDAVANLLALPWSQGMDSNHQRAGFRPAALPLSYPGSRIGATLSWRFGSGGRIRTYNLPINSRLLCHLATPDQVTSKLGFEPRFPDLETVVFPITPLRFIVVVSLISCCRRFSMVAHRCR